MESWAKLVLATVGAGEAAEETPEEEAEGAADEDGGDGDLLDRAVHPSITSASESEVSPANTVRLSIPAESESTRQI